MNAVHTWGDIARRDDVEHPAVLWMQQSAGILLRAGSLCVLDGDGAMGKTSLALQLALTAAGTPDGKLSDPVAGMQVAGSPALFVAFEDPPEELYDRVQALLDINKTASATAKRIDQHLHFLDLRYQPLYAAPDNKKVKPNALPAFNDLEKAIADTGARLVVLDSAFTAYAGSPASVGAVNQYLTALGQLAEKHHCGLLALVNATPSVARHRDLFATNFVLNPCRTILILTPCTTPSRSHLALQHEDRALLIAKASQAPSRMSIRLRTIVDTGESGAVVGFRPILDDADAWHIGSRALS